MTSDTTLVAIIAGVAVVVAAVIGPLLTWWLSRIARTQRQLHNELRQVHVLVDGRLSQTLNQLAILTEQIARDHPSDIQHDIAAKSARAAADSATARGPMEPIP